MSQHNKYKNTNPLHQYLLNRFLEHITSAVKETGAQKILDLASAQGYVIQRLRQKLPTASFVGVDIDEEALSDARIMNPGVDFVTGDITEFQPEQPVDLVMALEVLEHLSDVPSALKNLSAIQSNWFLFSVPHEPYFRGLNFLRGRHVRRLGNHPEHCNVWGKKRFIKTIEPYFVLQADYSSFPWIVLLAKKRRAEDEDHAAPLSYSTPQKIAHYFYNESFFHYTWIGIVVSVLNVFLLWLFIDVWDMLTVPASIIVVGINFILRYVLLRFTKSM
ncbi:MAG: methyltransferase domain-containing protein [bacterium]|nr:methyltransferase domain-containing protein [bacterium]